MYNSGYFSKYKNENKNNNTLLISIYKFNSIIINSSRSIKKVGLITGSYIGTKFRNIFTKNKNIIIY